MRFRVLIPLLAITSLLVMISIDYLLGSQAEFINAWSVVERLLGRSPAAGDSLIYTRLGALGELAAVIVVNLVIGSALALFTRTWGSRVSVPK